MEQMLFGNKKMSEHKVVNTTIVRAYLEGRLSIPDVYYIGTNCNRNHGLGDKGIRYINGRKCIICTASNKKRYSHPKTELDKKHKSAMDAYEDQKMLKELGLDLEGVLDSDLL